MIQIGDNLELVHPVMNAAGTCKYLEEVEKFARSSVSAVVLGSITVELREGNSGRVYYDGTYFSLNALGLPNPGLDYYDRNMDEMLEIVHKAEKKLIVSIAADNLDDYDTLASFFDFPHTTDGIEFNLSCPNVWSNGTQKKMFCFDIESVVGLLNEFREQPVGIKVSPFSDPAYLVEFAQAIDGKADWITAVNTFPNAVAYGTGIHPTITVGLAGLSGMALKPIALGQVFQYNQVLKQTKVVGAGGISHGRDVMDFLNYGAIAVQANTVYSNSGNIGVYTRILEEYLAIE